MNLAYMLPLRILSPFFNVSIHYGCRRGLVHEVGVQ